MKHRRVRRGGRHAYWFTGPDSQHAAVRNYKLAERGPPPIYRKNIRL
jgi:hypothetical protein